MAATTVATRASSRYAALTRHHGSDHPMVEQARRALELAKTEAAIARAIEAAPPLDPETLARIRALIPPAPASEKGAV